VFNITFFAAKLVAIAAENIITKKLQFITFRKKIFMVHFRVAYTISASAEGD
jgi:hypothetical protein